MTTPAERPSSAPFSELTTSSGEVIAGVPLDGLPDAMSLGSLDRPQLHNMPARLLAADRLAAKPGGFAPNVSNRGENDPRIARLLLGGGDQVAPYRFVLTPGLIGQTLQLPVSEAGTVAQTDVLRVALQDTTGAVDPNFTPYAINDFNASFFASPVAFAVYKNPFANISNWFVRNRPVNHMLGGLLSTVVPAGNTLRITELCSGRRPERWWAVAEQLAKFGITNIDAKLTDFVVPPLPLRIDVPEGVRFSNGRQNLFEPLPQLPPDQRQDVLLVTYGFDSVWLPGDIRIRREGNNWYQSVYRLKVADWNPQQQELIAALRAGQPLAKATEADYEGVFVEQALIPFDIDSHPYARQLRNFVGEGEAVSVPVGYINTVLEAFRTQLQPDGAFVIGEGGTFNYDFVDDLAVQTSGFAARYKMDNYRLAHDILNEVHGLDAVIYSVEDLAARFLSYNQRTDPTTVATIQQAGRQGVMIVRRKGAPRYGS